MLIFIHSDLTQSLFNIYYFRTFNKNLSVDDMENYYKDDKFIYLVVEVADLSFGFDLTIDEEKEIAVKIVTQSYSVVGIDGKKLMSPLVVGKLHVYYLHGLRIRSAGINFWIIMLRRKK